MNRELLHTKLIEWYELNKRILPWRETDDPYKIWISEIILQQTRVAQGMEYYHKLVTHFPDIQSLADAQEDEVLLYWQGLGYYSRARNLHKAAQLMKDNEIFHQAIRLLGDEAKGDEIFAALKSMPGVGDYTAGAIASFAFDLPYPALDGNVYRVLARLFDCEIAFDTTQGKKHFRRLAEELLDRERPRLFNSAIMELGALHCVPTAPDCHTCPLNTWCKALANNTVELLPVRKPRPKVRDRYLEYTIYIAPDHTTLIHQRKGNDIWKHLWEFPLKESPTPYSEASYSSPCERPVGGTPSCSEASCSSPCERPVGGTPSCSEASCCLPCERPVGGTPSYSEASYSSPCERPVGGTPSCSEASCTLTHVLSHQKLHARFVIKNVSELPEIPDTVVVSLNDLDNYAFSRLTLKALSSLALT